MRKSERTGEGKEEGEEKGEREKRCKEDVRGPTRGSAGCYIIYVGIFYMYVDI